MFLEDRLGFLKSFVYALLVEFVEFLLQEVDLFGLKVPIGSGPQISVWVPDTDSLQMANVCLQALQVCIAIPMPIPHARIAPGEARLDSLCPIVQPWSRNFPAKAHQDGKIVSVVKSGFVFRDPILLFVGRRSVRIGSIGLIVVRKVFVVGSRTAKMSVGWAILKDAIPPDRSLVDSVALHDGYWRRATPESCAQSRAGIAKTGNSAETSHSSTRRRFP